MRRVLVIGSNSVVGRACGDFLASDSSVCFAGRTNADFKLDIASPGARLPEGERFDAVIHSAADFGSNSTDDFFRVECVNALGALNACRIANQVGASHVVLISTMSAGYQPPDAYYGIYSLSKRHGEELADLYCRTIGLSLAILRPSQVYDAKSLCRKHQPLFYSIIDKAQMGDDIVFFGSNDAKRNLLFLEDLAEIVARTVMKRIAGAFNCQSPASARLSELAGIAQREFGRGGRVHFQPDQPDIADLPPCEDGPDLYAAIGYYPATSLAQGIARIRQARELP